MNDLSFFEQLLLMSPIYLGVSSVYLSMKKRTADDLRKVIGLLMLLLIPIAPGYLIIFSLLFSGIYLLWRGESS